MSARELGLDAQTLRQAFDRAFAVPPAPAAVGGTDILTIRVGGQRYALALREVAGLHPVRVLVPSVAEAPHLLGLAGFRGKLAAVYDLGGLLGHPNASEPRWLVLTAAPFVALAFEDFDGHVRVPALEARASATGPAAAEPVRFGVRGAVPCPDGYRPLIDLPTLLRGIGKGPP